MSEALLALIAATVALLGSPGPATLSLAAVGASGGFKNGRRYLAGILTGLICVIAASALGLAGALNTWPRAALMMQILGATYILYIAWKIATAPVLDRHSDDNQLPGFRDGFILNLLNPKAYLAMLAIFSQFRLPLSPDWLSWTVTGSVCYLLLIIIDTSWLLAGGLLTRAFSKPSRARALRITFAVLIVASTALMFVR